MNSTLIPTLTRDRDEYYLVSRVSLFFITSSLSFLVFLVFFIFFAPRCVPSRRQIMAAERNRDIGSMTMAREMEEKISDFNIQRIQGTYAYTAPNRLMRW